MLSAKVYGSFTLGMTPSDAHDATQSATLLLPQQRGACIGGLVSKLLLLYPLAIGEDILEAASRKQAGWRPGPECARGKAGLAMFCVAIVFIPMQRPAARLLNRVAITGG